MSWLYSRALVAEFSAGTCSDGAPFAQSNSTPTPPVYWSPGKMTDTCPPSQFGMTCEPLTASRGAELLTWFRAAFPAKTLAAPEKAAALTEPEAACGWRWPGSFAKFSPALCSWKTRQRLLVGDLASYSVTWPRWGTMRNGECSAHTTPAHLTSAIGSGLWQTPVADDAHPRAAGKWNSRGEPKLSAQVLYPTPAAQHYGTTNNGKRGDGSTYRTAGKPSLATVARKSLWPDGVPRNGGQLNPAWVAWLMGWPIGWTDLKPLEMDKCRRWRRLHGMNYNEGGANDESSE